MPRGGARAGAGRKPAVNVAANRAISTAVLDRLGELGIPGVKTEADYALHLMKTDKRMAGIIFTDCLNRKYGKPAQAVIAEGKLTIEVVEVGAANHPTAEAGTAQKVM